MNSIINMIKTNHSLSLLTFKDCSFDGCQGVYLSNSSSKGFNLDMISAELFSEAPNSVDSIFLDVSNNTVYFIEFKNVRSIAKKKDDLKIKIYSSVRMFFDNLVVSITGVHFNRRSFKLEYIIVSNDTINNLAYQTASLGGFRQNYFLKYLSKFDINGNPNVVDKITLMDPTTFDNFVLSMSH